MKKYQIGHLYLRIEMEDLEILIYFKKYLMKSLGFV